MRVLSNIEVKNPDCCHKVGQEMLRPFSIAFGHSYRIDDEITKLTHSCTRKTAIIVLAILLLPITILGGVIGVALLLCSSTHKMAYEQIQKKYFPPFKPQALLKATDGLGDYSWEDLMKISKIIIEDVYYRNLVPESIYKVKTFYCGDTVYKTDFPHTQEEATIYYPKVGKIVMAVRDQVEQKLGKAIRISQLLNELSTNHAKLFPYIF